MEALTLTRVELALGSVVERLRALGAAAIYIPSQLASDESPNLASGEATVVTGLLTSSLETEVILREDYPATFVGAPTRGVRGPLPEGRMSTTLDGSAQYLTAPGYVSAYVQQVTSFSPYGARLTGLSLVVLYKGGSAGEPLMCRSVGSNGKYGLFTDAFELNEGNRTGTQFTFPDASDADWTLLVVSMSHISGKSVWKDGVSLTLSGGITSSGSSIFCEADTGTLYIGRDVAGTDFFTGTIALAAFVPAPLDQDDVDALYAATQWTDVSSDVAGWAPVECEYGLPGDRPDDLVARTGELALTLKNAANNSAGLVGYYSPGHANCRAGFGAGIPIRFSLGYAGTTYYKFRGRVDSIGPAAGLRGALGTRVRAVDWFEEPALSPLPRLATETNLRADDGLQMVLDGMAQPPAFVDFDQGRDTFPYLFDTAPGSNSPAIGEITRLVRSERGFLYPVGDTAGGGTLRFENRHTRPLSDAFAATLDNTMFEIEAGRSRRDIITATTVTIHPRRIDIAATTVLYELADSVAPRIGPGQTIQWRAGYRDPDSPISRIAGTNIVTPVASTDYVMNTAEDGSGTDVTADVTVEFEHAGVYGVFRITNNTNTDAYVTTLQIRGKGLYQYADLLLKASDVGMLAKYGENHVAIDMAYQTDPNVGQGVADWVRALWSVEATGVSRLSFLANKSSALMTAALAVEPGQRVAVREDVTGITDVVDGANVGYFVHRVRYSLADGGLLRVSWTLAPADRERFWILDEVGASELDETTRWAYA